MLAAHHGAVDGFGLLALLGLALDAPVSSTARGIGTRPAGRGFLLSGLLRLSEALFTPPTRAAPVGPGTGSVRDALAAVEVRAARWGSTALA
ncbi:MAG: hypothetical protein ACRDT6_29285, partial [Micromonosporaceae bacterium]